jgi:hypothetical protein
VELENRHKQGTEEKAKQWNEQEENVIRKMVEKKATGTKREELDFAFNSPALQSLSSH